MCIKVSSDWQSQLHAMVEGFSPLEYNSELLKTGCSSNTWPFLLFPSLHLSSLYLLRSAEMTQPPETKFGKPLIPGKYMTPNQECRSHGHNQDSNNNRSLSKEDSPEPSIPDSPTQDRGVAAWVLQANF